MVASVSKTTNSKASLNNDNQSDSTTSSCSSSNSVPTPPRSRSSLPLGSRTNVTMPAPTKRDQSLKTSSRSLSVSFQGESFALPVSKTANNGAPDKKKAIRQSMSVDFTNEKMKLLSRSSVRNLGKKSMNERVCNNNNSDRVSSKGNNVRGGGGPRAIVVPARFWQETINLLKRVQRGPVTPLMSKTNKPISNIPQPFPRAKAMIHSSVSTRSGLDSISNHNLGNTNSILSFSADLKRGKKVGENYKVVDAQVLRVLHNKHLQWRFANAKVDATMLVQQAIAQKSLYNALVTISKIWISVLSKRVQVQQLKQNLKLHSVLKKQIPYLDKWDEADSDHTISLAGTILALESSSLRLPVLCGAKADVKNLNEALYAAFDVMSKMEASIYSLLNKVENVNSMASELSSAMKSESSLLDQCMDLLSTLTLLEVQDCSLRTHTLQLVAPCATTTEL